MSGIKFRLAAGFFGPQTSRPKSCSVQIFCRPGKSQQDAGAGDYADEGKQIQRKIPVHITEELRVNWSRPQNFIYY